MAEDRSLKYEVARLRREKRKLDIEHTIQRNTWTWSGYIISIISIVVIGFSYFVGPETGSNMVSFSVAEIIASDRTITTLKGSMNKRLLSRNASSDRKKRFF